MDYKVSVIIPVYGVEQYIERCARSLFEQTLDSIEYIFVNDCTPDNSMEVLHRVAKDYPNRIEHIKVIDFEENKGSAIARVSAMKKASGIFITYCDSDDWVDHETYKTMYDKAIDDGADIVVCDYYNTDGKEKQQLQCMLNTDRKMFIADMLYHRVSWSLCNKLFRRSLLDHPITYPTQSMGEDSAITLQLAYYSKKTTYVARPLYNYYQNEHSIVHSKSEDAVYTKFLQAIDNTTIIENFYREKDIYTEVKGGLAYLKHYTKSLLLPVIKNKTYARVWKQTFRHIEQEVLMDGNNSLSVRIKCLLILLKLYPRVTNFLRLTKCK